MKDVFEKVPVATKSNIEYFSYMKNFITVEMKKFSEDI